MTERGRRPLWGHPEEALFAFLAVATIAVLLALGRGMTFFADEWAVIERRDISLESWIQPFNEHWLGTTILAYRLLLGAVGLTSYLPYLAFVAVLHVIVAAEVLVLVRRAAGPLVGLAAAVVGLVFGSGFENLYWGMQIGFIGATALGLGAMILLEGEPGRGRIAAAVALLTLAMTTSGFALFMLAVVGLEVLADRRRWRLVPALAIPGVVYLAWFFSYGRSGVGFARDPFTAEAVADVPHFIVEGFGNAAGSAAGVGPMYGLAVAAIVLVVAGVRWARGRPPGPRFLGIVGGLVVMYALLGLVRGDVLDTAAFYPRYSYLSGILFLVAVAALVGTVRMPARPGTRSMLRALAVSVLAVSLVWNVRLLAVGRDVFLDRALLTRALVTVALDPALPPSVVRERDLVLVPSPASLTRIVSAHGSPLADVLAGPIPPIPDSVMDEAWRRVLEGAASRYPREGRPARPRLRGSASVGAAPAASRRRRADHALAARMSGASTTR